MDAITRELQLFEVISASDAMNNARATLEDAAAEDEGNEEMWEAIRRYVFPLLEAEHGRLDREYQRLR